MAVSTTFYIQSPPRPMVQMHDQHHPAGLHAPNSTPGSMDHITNNGQTPQNGGQRTLHPTTRWILDPARLTSTSAANKVNPYAI